VNVTENPVAISRAATVTIAAGTLTHTVTITQAAAAPTLTTDPTSIDAADLAGSYTIAVTSNAEWTAAVDAAATWVSLSPASATGNGTVTVNIAENPATVTRSATITFTAGTLNQTVDVTQDRFAAPPDYAASTQTWRFGEQIWSDLIIIPACDKEDFGNSITEPHCRSYTTDDSETYYYYNWPYVAANGSQLCTGKWRVPTVADFSALIASVDAETLSSAWPLSGYADASGPPETHGVYNVGIAGMYWSSEEDLTDYDEDWAFGLLFLPSFHDKLYTAKVVGHPVRCVR
jgi:hypothetical protein